MDHANMETAKLLQVFEEKYTGVFGHVPEKTFVPLPKKCDLVMVQCPLCDRTVRVDDYDVSLGADRAKYNWSTTRMKQPIPRNSSFIPSYYLHAPWDLKDEQRPPRYYCKCEGICFDVGLQSDDGKDEENFTARIISGYTIGTKQFPNTTPYFNTMRDYRRWLTNHEKELTFTFTPLQANVSAVATLYYVEHKTKRLKTWGYSP